MHVMTKLIFGQFVIATAMCSVFEVLSGPQQELPWNSILNPMYRFSKTLFLPVAGQWQLPAISEHSAPDHTVDRLLVLDTVLHTSAMQ